MAGFAVDIGDAGAAFEQGVTMPSATSTGAAADGLAMLGKGIFGALDDYARANQPVKQTESSIKREAVGRLSQSLYNLKGKTPLQKRTAVSSLVASYTNEGFDIDDNVAEMIKTATGVDVSYLNYDPAQEAINSSVDKLRENPGYVFNARKILDASGRPYTEDDVLVLAISDVQKVEAAALQIANSKVMNTKQFQEEYIPNARTMMGGIVNSTMSGLAIEMEGGDISPEVFVNLKTQFQILKSNLQASRPSGISDEDYKPIQTLINSTEELVTTLGSYDQEVLNKTKAEHLEVITKAIIGMPDMNPLIKAALLQPNPDFSAFLANNAPKVLETLNNIQVEDSQYTPLNQPLPEVPSDDSPEFTAPDLHTEDEVSKATDRTNKERSDAVSFASDLSINLETPESVNKPESRDNFLSGVAQASVNIATSPTLFSQQTISGILNDDTFKKLDNISRLDPEKAAVAKAQLKDALLSQFNVASTTASGSLQGSFWKVTGLGEVTFDTEARAEGGVFRMDRSVVPLVTTAASKYYNGSVSAMIVDRGRKLPTMERNQVQSAGFNFNSERVAYNKVLKQSEILKFYPKMLKKLGMDTAAIEAALIKPVSVPEADAQMGTEAKPYPIFWSDNTDTDEKMFANLNDGDYFIGPDGNTYVKGQQ